MTATQTSVHATLTIGAVAGWVCSPARLSSPASFVFCFHGGGYTADYFDFSAPGLADYSMAEHLAQLGHVVVAFDQPGIGASATVEDGTTLSVDVVTDAHHRATSDVLHRARLGTLLPDIGPLDEVTTTGLGHSMGGSLLVVQQGRHRTFDRIATLGTTALPREWGGEFAFDVQGGFARFDRAALRHGFYWDDVPEDVVAADERIGAAMPMGILDAPQVARSLATSIDVPLFLGFAERDVSPSPHREVSLYTGSRDVTLHVLPGSGHCSNFASGRRALWDRLSNWMISV